IGSNHNFEHILRRSGYMEAIVENVCISQSHRFDIAVRGDASKRDAEISRHHALQNKGTIGGRRWVEAETATAHDDDLRIANHIPDTWIGLTATLHNEPSRKFEFRTSQNGEVFDIFVRNIDADESIQPRQSFAVTCDEDLIRSRYDAGKIEQPLKV